MPEINYAVKFKHKVFRNIEFIRYFEFISDEDLVRTAEENYFLDVSSVVQQIEPFNKPFIVIHPGCGVIIEAHKKYSADKYVLLIEAMLKRYADIDIVLTGTEQEKKLNEFIFDKIDSQRLVNITARFNLDELIALFSQKNMKGIVCGDTGPAHLASVLKKPGIVMFGSTDDTVTSPFKYSCIVKTYPVLDCMPCYGTKKYGIKGCGDNQCMQTISIDKLLAKIDKIII
ncbi:MAG: glycosyltransferase family 9 protein [bacterium]|nr:glycosyltransferase family 9 protein [bacterium]